MALEAEAPPPSPWRAPLHVLMLFLLAAGLATGVLGLLETDRAGLLTRAYLDETWANIQTGFGLGPERGPWLLVVGTALVAFGLLFEVLVFLPVTAARRRPPGLPAPVGFMLLLLLLLLGMAVVAAAALAACIRLGGFRPSFLPDDLVRPLLSLRSLEARRWR
jgi:hypothetical protein